MLFKYNEFLQFEILNESNLYFSTEFRKILAKLSSKSKIAVDLFSVEKNFVKPDMTFIGLSDEPGSISFTQMKNVEKSIKNGLSTKLSTKYKSWDTNTIDSLIDLKINKLNTGQLSRGDIDQFWDSEEFDLKSKSRNFTSIGKLVRKIFPNRYTDTEIEDFVNLYKSTSINKFQFEIVSGDDIITWYNEKSYKESIGELGDSCMRYSRCSDYFDIYTKNPDVCQLLILKNSEGLIGRALLWTLENTVNGTNKFMDRIYSIDEPTKKLFEKWSDENGYIRRSNTKQHEFDKFVLGDTQITAQISVKLNNFKFDKYPYMDTLKRLDVESGTLHNDKEAKKKSYILTDTNGEFDDMNGKFSNFYQEILPIDNAVWSRPLNDWIKLNNSIQVEIGRPENHGFYPKESRKVKWESFREEWINVNDSIFSYHYQDFILADDAVRVVKSLSITGRYKASYSSEIFSALDETNFTEIENLVCSEFLREFIPEEYIHKRLLDWSKTEGKYFIHEFGVILKETSVGKLMSIDAEALGVDWIGDEISTDLFEYYYNMDKNLKIELKDKLEELVNNGEKKFVGSLERIKKWID
jgi:hypothetical protein